VYALRIGKHDRQQGLQLRHFFCQSTANKFISPSPQQQLFSSLPCVCLHSVLVAATCAPGPPGLAGRASIVPYTMKKNEKSARQLGCQSNSSSLFLNFSFSFLIFILHSSSWLVYLHFPRAEKGAGTYTHKPMRLQELESSYITLFSLLLLFYRSRGKIDL
jgi:hypothetical protein